VGPSLETAAPATAKRDAILEAALDLFAERGFHGTAVPLIAERAGVGAGTVYRYFESKEAIVNALYRSWKQTLSASILAAISPEQPPREQFHVYWTKLADFARKYPKVYSFLELHHHSPYLDDESRALTDRLIQLALASFADFRRQQVVKDVAPEIMMAIVHGAFVGLVKACSFGSNLLTPDAVATAEQCVWEAIRR
jgi:AcrR family transcriptional regulator